MKVLIIPTWYPGESDKLIGIYHKEYCEALNKHGIDADMIFINRQRLSKPFKYIMMKKKNVVAENNYTLYEYNILDLAKFGYDFQMKRYIKCLEKAVRRYIKEHGRVDVLHAQVTAPAGVAASVVGKKLGIPVVVTEHASYMERFFSKSPYKKYGLETLKNCYFTVVSKYMQKIVLKYSSQCDILPNQVDVDLFKNDVTRVVNDEFRLVTVCALREGKGIDYAIKAIKKLVDFGIKIHYNVIGDGFLENYYKSVVKEMCLEDHVSFLGRKSKKEVAELLKSNHALLVASEIESFGIPAVEALASGMPVISTDCLGVPAIIDSKCGEICEINNIDDMARAIKHVIDHYESYDKKYMEQVADVYSEKNVCKKAKEIYENLISK